MYEICSKVTIKTPERLQWHKYDVFIVDFEQIHSCRRDLEAAIVLTHFSLIFHFCTPENVRKSLLSDIFRMYKYGRFNWVKMG